MKRIVCVAVWMAGLAGCASSGAVVQYGGVEREVARPANAAPCEGASIRLVREGDMVIPRAAMPAFHSTSSAKTLSGISIVYDVASDGRAANIRYGGNPNDYNSDARRELIRAMADQVATFEYTWEGQASHAVSCRYALEMDL